MKELSDRDRDRLRKEVEQEFPDDPMMQELHYIRLVRYHELESVAPEDRFREYVRSGAMRRA